MRTIKLLGAAFLLLCSCQISFAQKQAVAPIIRCATEEALQQTFKEHPEFKAEYNRRNTSGVASRGNATSRVSALSGPVTIPVIVHVVLPNPTVITEQQIDYFLNRLNTDYSGLNADSTNGPLFYPVRGHSLLRFTRARRTPAGQITNGIERRVGTGTIAQTTYQAIKHATAGGLDPWDVTQYYNLWVGQSTTLLGIAPAIGVGNQTETTTSTTGIDGVCVNYIGFSNGCFSDPAFALGRTAVHEIGHNFGLYHIFSGCAAGADFAQPTPAGQTLPANLVGAAGDDTPGQLNPTSGCLSGAVASDCPGVPNPPGKMYQNYMDYTDDPCYSMFTRNQVARMEYMLEFYRPGYLTTLGATLPTGSPAVDAGFNAIIYPGGSELNTTTCTFNNYAAGITCSGPAIPRVSVTNYGSVVLASVSATVTVGGVASTPAIFNVNLQPGSTAVISFPSVTLAPGANVIQYTIINANGVADPNATNNVITNTVTTTAPIAAPFTQDFVATTFPPANMTINNPNANVTWVRRPLGNGNIGSAFFDNYNNSVIGQIDELRTFPIAPPAGSTSCDSLVISFDVAHKNFAGSFDTLSVYVSSDCGQSFTRIYGKSGPTLATAGASTAAYTTPIASDWRRERITLNGSYLTNGSIIVAFRNTNDYGNNIFLDNISVTPVIIIKRDVQLVSINQPFNVTCQSITPAVTVRNRGSDVITSFKVGYQVDNGTPVVTTINNVSITCGNSLTVNLNGSNVSVGSHSFKAFTYDPVSAFGTGDQNVTNDTLTKSFQVVATQAAPLVEGFESNTFPPTGWGLNNADGLLSWQRTLIARRSSTDTGSAYVNNFAYPANGSQDELYTPRLTYQGIDSLFLNFNVAATTYSYPGSTAIPLDTLEVLITTDCGNTFRSIYKKWGNELQTVNDPNSPQTTGFVPSSRNQWRNEAISLSAFINSSPIQVVFRNTTNFENNIFLDNINISTKTLPAQLKEQGYLIYPVPFTTSFTIQHYVSPTELRSVGVYNSVGQLMISRNYAAGTAASTIAVDMSRYASGLYTVVLRYSNRTISQKIIKAR